MPIIVGLNEDYTTEEHDLAQTPFTIGRLARSDVCIKNTQVSRRHAQVTQQEGAYYLEDLGSANGVFVNNQPITRARLTHGDTFNVGGVAHFVFLERPDAFLIDQTVELIRSSSEFSPATYSMKKTVKLLVHEVSRQTEPGHGFGEQVTSPSMSSRTDELEILLGASYVLNSSLSLKEVLETLLLKVLQITKAARGFILLINPRTRSLEAQFARDLKGPLTESQQDDLPKDLVDRAVNDGTTLDGSAVRADPELQKLMKAPHLNREFLLTPLKVRTSTIGGIYVDRPSQVVASAQSGGSSELVGRTVGGPFIRRDILLFEALCQQAAIAIENSRLTDDLKDNQRKLKIAYDELVDKNTRLQVANEKLDQKVAELAALNAVSRGMNLVSTLDQVLKLILEKTVELLGVEKGSLLLVNEDSDTMELRAIVGLDRDEPIAKMTRLRVGEGIAGLALRQGVPLAINDGHRNPQFKMLLPADTSIRHLMCVPLLSSNRKIGVINLTNKISGTGFTENDKSLVTTMASQAAITIENARLYNLAIFDGLTSLYVARYFHLYLDKEIQRVRRYGGVVSLVMADLDFFKTVNDTHGHQVGDIMLQKVAQVIRAAVRANDVAARYGGEEFAVVLPETDLAGATVFAERLRASVEDATVRLKDRVLKVTISIGVAGYPTNTSQGKVQLIALADKALLEAKRTGRNQVRICQSKPPPPVGIVGMPNVVDLTEPDPQPSPDPHADPQPELATRDETKDNVPP